MTELEPLRKRVRELEDQFRNLITGEGWSIGILQDEGVPGHWELNYRKKNKGEGACCFPDGTCSILSFQDCLDAGGSFLSNGTTCSPNPCSGFCVGACCSVDGSCTVERQITCEASGGTWQGCGTDCDPNPCSVSGACCFPDGTCNVESSSQCTSDGGTYQGDGTTCEDCLCTSADTGACCFSDGTCTTESAFDCCSGGGSYQGDGTTCSPNPCGSTTTGACCTTRMDGSPDCQITTAAACTGLYFGDGSICHANGCCLVPSGGGCSYGSFSGTTQECCDLSGGHFIGGHGPLCGDYHGACCFFDGVFFDCVQTSEFECSCVGGTFYGIGTPTCDHCP